MEKCDEVLKWIFLTEEEKHNYSDEEFYLEHIANCKTCREKWESIKDMNKTIYNLSRREPELNYPQVLTQNIIESISDKKTNKLNLLDSLVLNKLKLAASILIIGLIGYFFYQQAFIISKLNKMEDKIAQTQNSEVIGATSFMNSKLVKRFSSEVKGDPMIIDEEALNLLIESYLELEANHNELIKLINENLKSFEGKLSKQEIKELKELLNSEKNNRSKTTNI